MRFRHPLWSETATGEEGWRSGFCRQKTSPTAEKKTKPYAPHPPCDIAAWTDNGAAHELFTCSPTFVCNSYWSKLLFPFFRKITLKKVKGTASYKNQSKMQKCFIFCSTNKHSGGSHLCSLWQSSLFLFLLCSLFPLSPLDLQLCVSSHLSLCSWILSGRPESELKGDLTVKFGSTAAARTHKEERFFLET